MLISEGISASCHLGAELGVSAITNYAIGVHFGSGRNMNAILSLPGGIPAWLKVSNL